MSSKNVKASEAQFEHQVHCSHVTSPIKNVYECNYHFDLQ